MNRIEIINKVLGHDYDEDDFDELTNVLDYFENAINDVIKELECDSAEPEDKVANALDLANSISSDLY